jgi:tetratricopeptide (TPR) repeat protein
MPPDTPLFRDDLQAGAALFDRGKYWQAHEIWERAWRGYAGSDRHYFRGLIQIAAMNYHLKRGNRSAARRLLDSALRNLHDARPLDWPFDCAHMTIVLAAVAAKLDCGRLVKPVDLNLSAMLPVASC